MQTKYILCIWVDTGVSCVCVYLRTSTLVHRRFWESDYRDNLTLLSKTPSIHSLAFKSLFREVVLGDMTRFKVIFIIGIICQHLISGSRAGGYLSYGPGIKGTTGT